MNYTKTFILMTKKYWKSKHPQIDDQASDGIKNFCGEFQPLSAEDPAHQPQYGSKRLELSFKNAILYHGFEDASTKRKKEYLSFIDFNL